MTDDISAGGAATSAVAVPDDQPAAEPSGGAGFHALALAADPALAAQVTLAADSDLAWPGEAVAYDGHVALALDASLLPDLDGMLDVLTVAHDLFDVPAMDFGGDAPVADGGAA